MKAEMNGVNEKLVALLIERGLKISSAESCTGGMLAALITDVSGSSEIFEESIVTYSNEAKMRELGVSKSTLERVGAVSRVWRAPSSLRLCAPGSPRRVSDSQAAHVSALPVPGVGAAAMGVFLWIRKRFQAEWIDSFSLAGSMLAAMCAAIFLAKL